MSIDSQIIVGLSNIENIPKNVQNLTLDNFL